jgi:hypothetical protein
MKSASVCPVCSQRLQLATIDLEGELADLQEQLRTPNRRHARELDVLTLLCRQPRPRCAAIPRDAPGFARSMRRVDGCKRSLLSRRLTALAYDQIASIANDRPKLFQQIPDDTALAENASLARNKSPPRERLNAKSRTSKAAV